MAATETTTFQPILFQGAMARSPASFRLRSPANTYWYISGTPEFLQTAAELINAPGQEGVRQ